MKIFLFYALLMLNFIKAYNCREFCGSTLIFPKLEICCSGRVFEKPGYNSKCCGFKPYNTDLKLCCNNLIQDKPYLHAKCCQSQSYNPEHQQCCFGNKIISRKKRCKKREVFDMLNMSKNGLRFYNGPLEIEMV
jgi:hypothetical protein